MTLPWDVRIGFDVSGEAEPRDSYGIDWVEVEEALRFGPEAFTVFLNFYKFKSVCLKEKNVENLTSLLLPFYHWTGSD